MCRRGWRGWRGLHEAAAGCSTAPVRTQSFKLKRSRRCGDLHAFFRNDEVGTVRKLVRIIEERNPDVDIQQCTHGGGGSDAFTFHQFAHALWGQHLIARRQQGKAPTRFGPMVLDHRRPGCSAPANELGHCIPQGEPFSLSNISSRNQCVFGNVDRGAHKESLERCKEHLQSIKPASAHHAVNTGRVSRYVRGWLRASHR